MKTADFGEKINNSPSISSFRDRVISIFRRKQYGSDLLELDIKAVIPAPTHKIIT